MVAKRQKIAGFENVTKGLKMAYEHQESFGSIFTNHKKDKDNQPDWRGDFKLNGQIYEIAGWNKSIKNGPMISIKVQPKREKPTEPPTTEAPRPELDDEIVF